MKWLFVSCVLVCMALEAEMGVTKCAPGSSDEFCLMSEEDIEPSNGPECLAGSTWSSHCNACTCTKKGRAICTKNLCFKSEDEIDYQCAPGTSWKNSCNNCQCTKTGMVACTRKGCDNKLNSESTEDATSSATATAPSVVRGAECAIGSEWQSQCNLCVCNEDGYHNCTSKVCPGMEDEAEMQCALQTSWMNDCNQCWCDNGRPVCTKIGCNTPIVEIEFDDDDNQTQSKDVILETNVSQVRKTRAAPTQEPPKTCTPGQEFRMDCNTCLCDNEGQDFSCTRIDCNNNKASRRKREVAKQEIKQCEPGSVFQQDCNVCRCNSDGHHATCTLKRCDIKPANEEKADLNSDLPGNDPDFRCNPGEQFKRDCNDCSCSADGRSVFCTIRLCDNDIISKI